MGYFVQDFKLVYNKADSSTKALKIMCEDPVNKLKSELTTDPTEKFDKYLSLANSDPYYVCGVQFKYNSSSSAESDAGAVQATEPKDFSLMGLKARICQAVVMRQVNITY